MKKLLLCAVLTAACVTDVSASVFQTKSSKNNVDTTLKADMGTHYKGMVNLVNSLVVGWADSLSYAAKDPDFKNEKTQLSNAGKKLKIIAKFTESMLNRDREKSITSNNAKAVTAAQAFQAAVNVLKTTEYWKHCGAQLRLSVVIITNALQSLAQKDIQFNVAGGRVSSSEGFIDGNGYASSYDLADVNALTENASVVGTSSVSNLLSVFKMINKDLAIGSVSSNVTVPVQVQSGNLETWPSDATLVAQPTSATVATPTPVQQTVTTPVVTPTPQAQSTVSSGRVVTRARR